MTPVSIRTDVAVFLNALHNSGAPPMEALSVEAARAMMREISAMSDLPAVPLAVKRDLVMTGSAGSIGMRLYDRRATRDAGPLILFFHGGGFVVGDIETHDSFCSWLADAIDLPLLATDYRRAPEHPFPAAPDDAETVARWAASSPAEIDRTVSSLITCGDSAGGNLAIVTAQSLAARPAAVPMSAQWAIYPFCGGGTDWPSGERYGDDFLLGRETMDWFDGHYGRPGDDPRHNCLLGEIPAQVPLLVQTASLDPLRDQGLDYVRRARAAGANVHHIEADGMIHGFVTMRMALPSAQGDAEAFVRAARAMLAAT